MKRHGRQEIGNSTVPVNLRVINNIIERNKQQYLLFSMTYSVDSFYMKKLHMGIQSTKEGIFEPIVELTDNFAEEINFDSNTWK